MKQFLAAIAVISVWIGGVLLPRFPATWLGVVEISLERRYALSAAVIALAGTLWISAGVWLTRRDIGGLRKISPGKTAKVKLLSQLLIGAHVQLYGGLAILAQGFVLQCFSAYCGIVGW